MSLMTASKNVSTKHGRDTELEFTTFYVGDLHLGIDIHHVEEINRQLDLTIVPHAPACVRGLVNLRGEVVTVVDLRTSLGLERVELTGRSRNVVVSDQGERIGLIVDRIGDVVDSRESEIEPPPANLKGVDGRFFRGICKLNSDLLVLLDVQAAIAAGREEQ